MTNLTIPGYEDVRVEYIPFAIPPKWMDRGACQYGDPDLFYPKTGQHGASGALAFCNICPVKTKCYDYAVSRDEPYGVWGGQNMTGPKAMADRRNARARRFRETGIVYIHGTRAMTEGDGIPGGYLTTMIDNVRADVRALEALEAFAASEMVAA